MTATFKVLIARLQKVHGCFDREAIAETRECLHQLRTVALRRSAPLAAYHACLLFLCAHPTDAAMLAQVESELRRIASFMRRHTRPHGTATDLVGLPYVKAVVQFSHDCLRWLLRHPHCRVTFEGYHGSAPDLNALLRATLPALEQAETNAGYTNDELLDALGVKSARRLDFLVAELSRLDHTPQVKDHLFDALGVMAGVTPTHVAFSLAFNRLPIRELTFLTERLTSFDALALMNRALPRARRLGATGNDEANRVIRNAMALTARETDPATYLDSRSLRVFDLERGVSVAIFGMTPDRQLALESYVGFTAFRNGLPVAYGGSWVFGERADFGMNVFDPYRGGESGYLMCQLLRVYRQAFGIRYFEVDASQFGLGNPEGIDTGAFWFYYKYGFRPVDRELARSARAEKQRLNATAGARSTRAVLTRFTGSSLALNFGGRAPAPLYDVTARVTRMVSQAYRGNRPSAEQDCVTRFLAATRMRWPGDRHQRVSLAEFALVARSLRVTDAASLRLLRDMQRTKPVDVYRYQRALTALLQRRRAR